MKRTGMKLFDEMIVKQSIKVNGRFRTRQSEPAELKILFFVALLVLHDSLASIVRSFHDDVSSNKINHTLYSSKNFLKMGENSFAAKVVDSMIGKDLFSKWLGIEIIEIRDGYSKIKMAVRKEMVNAFGIAHGGIAFSMADSAFAFACNNRNNLSVALDTSINFIKPVHVGDILVAEAIEVHNGKSTGLYQITIVNQHDHVVALFKGTCFRTNKKLIED